MSVAPASSRSQSDSGSALCVCLWTCVVCVCVCVCDSSVYVMEVYVCAGVGSGLLYNRSQDQFSESLLLEINRSKMLPRLCVISHYRLLVAAHRVPTAFKGL